MTQNHEILEHQPFTWPENLEILENQPFWWLGSLEILEHQPFWTSGNLEILEHQPFWSFGHLKILQPSVSILLEESPYMWTARPCISGRLSIYGRHGPYLEAPCCLGTFRQTIILGTCSWKYEYGDLGNKVKTSNFLKMAPQAKPLCS